MISMYRIQPNNTNNRTKKAKNPSFDETTSPNNDHKRPQMTTNDLKRSHSISESSPEVKPVKSKNKLKGDANVEINEHYLDRFLHSKDS